MGQGSLKATEGLAWYVLSILCGHSSYVTVPWMVLSHIISMLPSYGEMYINFITGFVFWRKSCSPCGCVRQSSCREWEISNKWQLPLYAINVMSVPRLPRYFGNVCVGWGSLCYNREGFPFSSVTTPFLHFFQLREFKTIISSPVSLLVCDSGCEPMFLRSVFQKSKIPNTERTEMLLTCAR